MYAVIDNKGKQYRVEPGEEIQVDLMDVPAGEVIEFARVLLVGGQSPLTPRRALGPAVGMAVLFVIAIGAATAAFERSSLTAVAIVISQYPAATLILAALIWKQRPRPVQYLGVAMTLAAVAAIAVA